VQEHKPLVILAVSSAIVALKKHRLKTVQTNPVVAVNPAGFTTRTNFLGHLHKSIGSSSSLQAVHTAITITQAQNKNRRISPIMVSAVSVMVSAHRALGSARPSIHAGLSRAFRSVPGSAASATKDAFPETVDVVSSQL
jgi:hypothetical protein